MFVGHMDTVFPRGTLAHWPFSTDGVNAYGPGVGDMKNGDVAMYQVAAHLSKRALEKLNICMAYNPDEEIGSIYSKEKLDEIGRKSDYVYVMESASGNGGRHCFARKGMMRYVIQFHGQAAHAGFMFERENASAVLEMGHYIVKLMGLASREEDTTVNVGVAKGGTATNVVADFAEIWVEMRFKKESERERLAGEVDQLLHGEPFVPGVRVEVAHYDDSPAWTKTPEALAHIAHMESLAESLGIPFTQKDRGGLSDANHLSTTGAVCSDGMGPEGEQLTLRLARPAPVDEVYLVFDPNLSEERCISVSKAFLAKEPIGVAETLVRDYRVDLLLNGAVVASQSVTANHQRRNTVTWPHVECDQVRLTVLATNGCADARVYEIRVY